VRERPHLALGAQCDVAGGLGDLAHRVRASLEVDAIWWDAPVSEVAERVTSPTSERRPAPIFANDCPRMSRLDFGCTSTVRSPAAIRSAAAAVSIRDETMPSNDGVRRGDHLPQRSRQSRVRWIVRETRTPQSPRSVPPLARLKASVTRRTCATRGAPVAAAVA
jgi:hypothetical protein